MKQLICEMCGSKDLLKQDGIFVCQTCGTKYSVEDAKKMMVEGVVEVQGTVKVDKTSEIKNLYDLAEKVLKFDLDKAKGCTEKILEIDPNNYMGWKLRTRIEFFEACVRNTFITRAVACAKTAYSCASEEEKKDLINFLVFEICYCATFKIESTLNTDDELAKLEFIKIATSENVFKLFEPYRTEGISFLKEFYDTSEIPTFNTIYENSLVDLTREIALKKKFPTAWLLNVQILEYLNSFSTQKDWIYNIICANLILIVEQRYETQSFDDVFNDCVTKLFDSIENAKLNNPNFVLDNGVSDYIKKRGLKSSAQIKEDNYKTEIELSERINTYRRDLSNKRIRRFFFTLLLSTFLVPLVFFVVLGKINEEAFILLLAFGLGFGLIMASSMAGLTQQPIGCYACAAQLYLLTHHANDFEKKILEELAAYDGRKGIDYFSKQMYDKYNRDISGLIDCLKKIIRTI